MGRTSELIIIWFIVLSFVHRGIVECLFCMIDSRAYVDLYPLYGKISIIAMHQVR